MLTVSMAMLPLHRMNRKPFYFQGQSHWQLAPEELALLKSLLGHGQFNLPKNTSVTVEGNPITISVVTVNNFPAGLSVGMIDYDNPVGGSNPVIRFNPTTGSINCLEGINSIDKNSFIGLLKACQASKQA